MGQQLAAVAQVATAPGQHVQTSTETLQQAPEDPSKTVGWEGLPHVHQQQLTSLAPVGLDSAGDGGEEAGLISPEAALAATQDEREGECDPPTADGGHDPSAEHEHPSEGEDDGPKPKRPAGTQQCPRCSSQNTKFCYYNNYNIKQPRYYCRVSTTQAQDLPRQLI